MTIRRGKKRRALVVLAVLCLLAASVFFFWLMNSAPTTLNPQANETPAANSAAAVDNNSNADQLALMLNQHLRKIKSIRHEAEEPFKLYLNDRCDSADKMQGERVDLKRLVELARCQNSVEKFAAYHEKLDALFKSTENFGPIETLVASLQAKAKLGEQQTGRDTSKDGSFSTSFLWGMAASLAVSALILLLLMGRNFSSQRLMAATISQGFGALNDSLGRLHDVLIRPEQSEPSQGDAKESSRLVAISGNAQGDEQARSSFDALSTEVRQGFSSLQESLRPTLHNLDKYLLRLVNQSDKQSDATPVKPEAEKPPSQALELSKPPPMRVKEYKKKFSVVECVNPGYQTRYLEKNHNGELSVLKDTRSEKYYLIPNNEWLQTPSYFHQKYAAYYDVVELRAGSIEVTSPAIVRPDGSQWFLERKGTLTIHKLS